MYCSNCGAEASGNFCSKCGAPLKPQGQGQNSAPPPPAPAPDAPPPEPHKDWSHEVHYETLLRVPEVRDLIARATASKQQHVSAEAFLAAADKLVSLAGMSVPTKTITDVALPIFQQMGVKTGKTRLETIDEPVGQAIVAALCALAGEGQDIRSVQQLDNGCVIEAVLPSDFRSWEGSLFVSLRATDKGTQIEAGTSIKGQMFDWGKSTQSLDTLFAAFHAAPRP